MTDARLFRLLRLSIGAAVATITLKVLAWSLTGSSACCRTPPSPS